MIFTPTSYGVWDSTPAEIGGMWLPGQWRLEGSLDEHRQESEALALKLEDGALIKRAALFAWFTSATQRQYVTLRHESKTYTTRYLAREIEHNAKTEIAQVVARTLFGVPAVREMHYDQARITQAPFRIHIENHQDPDTPYEEAPQASDQEWALGIAVAGATAMLNEIDYGHVPKGDSLSGG